MNEIPRLTWSQSRNEISSNRALPGGRNGGCGANRSQARHACGQNNVDCHKIQHPASHATSATGYKLPPGEKRIPGIPKMAMPGWKFQDILVGKGPEGESGKMWHLKYKGWRAADGVVFDSWENNRRPEFKDGKPVMGPDGKPVMGEPQPLAFPQGAGRLIPGFDWAVAGMHVGGKRRIFIPWELAYGTRSIPDRPDHPGIPPKSDLIFDVELVEVTDAPAMPPRPMMPQRPMPHPGATASNGSASRRRLRPQAHHPRPRPPHQLRERRRSHPAQRPIPARSPQSKPAPPPPTPQK